MNKQRLIAAVFLFFLLLSGWLTGAGTAVAHANIARAEPGPDAVLDAPPSEVVVWFTEPLEGEFSEILVYAADRTRVDNNDSRLLDDDPMGMVVTLVDDPPLAEGIYTVAWKSVSTVDGHIVRSSYVFSIGQPLPGQISDTPESDIQTPARPIEPVIRWLLLLSVAGIFGGLAFDLFVIRPGLARFGAEIPDEHHRNLTGRILEMVWFWTIVFLIASTIQLFLQTSSASGVPVLKVIGQPLAALLTNTYWGHLWLWRMGLWLVLVAVLPLSARTNGNSIWGESWERPREIISLLLMAAVMMTLSLVSHAFATMEIRITAVISDYIHLLAAGAWAGGLSHFAWNARYMLRRLPVGSRRSFFAIIVPRFSALAGFSVASLFLTGLFSSYAQVTMLSALNTPYGRTLLIKLAFIAPLLMLGAVNLFYLGRRLAVHNQASVQLARTVWSETLLVVLVLFAVAFLVTMEPARQVVSRERAEEAEAADSRLRLEEMAERLTAVFLVDVAEVGDKEVTVELWDVNGQPIENASDVILTIRYPAEDLEPFIGRPRSVDTGVFAFDEVPFSLSGEWQADLVVVRPTAFDAHLSYDFEVGGETAVADPADNADSGEIVPSRTVTNWLFGFVVVGLLLVGAFIFSRFR